MRGIFISFEGPDGSGKSTHIRLLNEELLKMGHCVLVTREPGGCRVSELIREIVLSPEYKEMTPEAEALLYAAARAQHVRQVVLPALERGEIVVTDRYIDSSIAYQGYGRGLGAEFVAGINAMATGGLLPDLTFLMLVEPQETHRRMSDREHDRLEMADMDFHERVFEAFRRIARENPGRFVTVDAALPKAEVHRAVMDAVKERISSGSLSVKSE